MTAQDKRSGAGGPAAGSAGREIVIGRTFDAPRQFVFDAFTDAAHIDQWWGPDGFTNATHSMDVRPGGKWQYMMRAPDGTEYDNVVTYRELRRPERLVYDHGDATTLAMFQVIVTFVKQGDRTALTMHSIFPTPEAHADALRNGAVEGGQQTLDRLAGLLETAHGL